MQCWAAVAEAGKTIQGAAVLPKALVFGVRRYYINTTAARRRSNPPESNMRTTYRAAYIAAHAASNSGGWVLTLPQHAGLSDADLMAEALKGLKEYNENCNSDNGCTPATEADIVIGDWTE